LTFFRQNALTQDGVLAYDPMGGSYAFSPIGWQGVTCGVGDTEDCRVTTAAKYNLAVGGFRAAGLAQMGGYQQGNGANAQYQVSLGGDIPFVANGVLSLDGIYSSVKDGVNLTVLGTAPFPVTATISDNSSVMLLGKYATGPVRLYAGYERIRFAPPSDPQTAFVDISGEPIGRIFANNTAINNTAYGPSGGLSDRIMQIVWTGLKYAITDKLDVTGAYYHYGQNDFTRASCANRLARPQCSGTMDAYSAMVDWKFAAKFDTYAGFMVSQVNGGLANGYVARNNFAPTGGLRFRF
jgi:predicted porin